MFWFTSTEDGYVIFEEIYYLVYGNATTEEWRDNNLVRRIRHEIVKNNQEVQKMAKDPGEHSEQHRYLLHCVTKVRGAVNARIVRLHDLWISMTRSQQHRWRRHYKALLENSKRRSRVRSRSNIRR